MTLHQNPEKETKKSGKLTDLFAIVGRTYTSRYSACKETIGVLRKEGRIHPLSNNGAAQKAAQNI